MECLFSWGLLARNRWLFWGVFAQILLFHLVSFSVVGFYYPILMVLLLSVFPLSRFRPDPGPEPIGLLRSLWWAPSRLPTTSFSPSSPFSSSSPASFQATPP